MTIIRQNCKKPVKNENSPVIKECVCIELKYIKQFYDLEFHTIPNVL